MNMIEKVARAIFLSYNSQVDFWNELPWALQQKYKEHAKAAIEAMREPTEEMLANTAYGDLMSKQVWQAIIDAALKE